MTNAMTLGNAVTAERVFKIGQAFLVVGFFAALATALVPDLRSEVRNTLVKDYRAVVSTASADLIGNGTAFTIAKVRTRDSLSLEIYRTLTDGTMALVEKIEMPDKKDGFFKFNGEATNLAIDDIDGDGRPEILAPSFDSNLVGRLNVYHYDMDSKSFNRAIR